MASVEFLNRAKNKIKTSQNKNRPTVVEQTTGDPKFQGSNPTSPGTLRENNKETMLSFQKKVFSYQLKRDKIS